MLIGQTEKVSITTLTHVVLRLWFNIGTPSLVGINASLLFLINEAK